MEEIRGEREGERDREMEGRRRKKCVLTSRMKAMVVVYSLNKVKEGVGHTVGDPPRSPLPGRCSHPPATVTVSSQFPHLLQRTAFIRTAAASPPGATPSPSQPQPNTD